MQADTPPATKQLTPLLIYQMGKVGSRTLQASLMAIMPSEQELYHLHQLHDLDRIEREVLRGGPASSPQLAYFAAGRALRERFDARYPPSWDVITLVREPVGRNLSAFFYALEQDAPQLHEEICRGRIDHDALLSWFLHDFDHDYACNWFAQQFEPVFGLDVFTHTAPRADAHRIIESDRVRLLLMRTEDLERQLEPAIEDFLGWPSCKPKASNSASEKGYATIYREFLDRVLIPDAYLDRMYDSELARHFYRADEIADLRRAWRKRSERARPEAAAPKRAALPLVLPRDPVYTWREMVGALGLVHTLGLELERAWAERDFDPEVFIELSTVALARARLEQHVSAGELLAQIASPVELPEERTVESRVVDEQITLFRCPHFVIELLIWIDGITDVHDHRLSGAYVALEGDRIEAQYGFFTDEWIDDSLRIGRLLQLGMQRVRVGQIRPFTPGTDDLHAVFHLDHPSVTLAIRAPRLDVDAGFNYLRPGLAVKTKISPRARQQLRALHSMQAAGYPQYEAVLERALLDAEPLDLFLLLNEHRAAYAERLPELRELLTRLRETRGPWVDTLARAFVERTRMMLIRTLRQAQRGVDHRLALALLLHARTLDDLPGARTPEVLAALHLVAEHVPALRADVERLKTD